MSNDTTANDLEKCRTYRSKTSGYQSKNGVARGVPRHSFAEVVKKPVKVSDEARRRKNDLPHRNNGLQKGDTGSSDSAHKYDEQSGWRQDQFDGKVCMSYTTGHEETEWLQSCLVAKVKDAATIKFLSDDIVSESKFGCKVSVMGGSLVLLRFNNRELSEHFLKSYLDTMEPWFHYIRRWDDETIDDERITWISVVGVPVKAFSIGFFVELSNQWGSFIAVDDSTLHHRRLDVARVSLSTSLKNLPETCSVDIDGRTVTLSIKEDLGCNLLPIPYLNSHQAQEEDTPVMAEGGHSREDVDYKQDEDDSDDDVNAHHARNEEPPLATGDALHSSCRFDRRNYGTEFENTVTNASSQSQESSGTVKDCIERYFEDGCQKENDESKNDNTAQTCFENCGAKSRDPLASTEDNVTISKNMEVNLSSDLNGPTIGLGFYKSTTDHIPNHGSSNEVELGPFQNPMEVEETLNKPKEQQIINTNHSVNNTDVDSSELVENHILENKKGMKLSMKKTRSKSKKDSLVEIPIRNESSMLSDVNPMFDDQEIEFSSPSAQAKKEAEKVVEVAVMMGLACDGSIEDLKERVYQMELEDNSRVELKKIWKLNDLDARWSNSEGASGGIIIMWKQGFFKLLDHREEFSFIILKGTLIRLGVQASIVNVYAPNDMGDRRGLWRLLRNHEVGMEGLWVLGGDWNDILNIEERLGQNYVDASMRDFQSFVNDCSLVDIPMSGANFTWSNGESNLSMSRLDRFLISSEWLAQLNQTRQWCVKVSFSDHHAVAVGWDSVNWGPKPFKTFNWWLEDPTCMACFQNAWKSSQNLYGAGFSLLEKFKNVKQELKAKFGKRFISLVEEIKMKENRLFQVEVLRQSNANNSDFWEEYISLKHEVKSLRRKEASNALQKSRAKWLKLGDCNSKFFHILYNNRIISNSIDSICVKGEVISNPSVAKRAIADFFKAHFNNCMGPFLRPLNGAFKSISRSGQPDAPRSTVRGAKREGKRDNGGRNKDRSRGRNPTGKGEDSRDTNVSTMLQYLSYSSSPFHTIKPKSILLTYGLQFKKR
ncbi:Endonuclease/exonuclease/phosphatase [Artemisia annua]|uniref:Endonuclease/exonuclease/phosphatase n=1 Tax=Artemisia annua TaxID=35608 RepID=A0A2U1PEY1_ARTAN|nr:Endonuclease/exonuclease/phosphatase [Artemisia annua]